MSKNKILDWLANSQDTGLSSKSLAFEYLGIEQKIICWPWDPADFGRCARLIIRVPDVRSAVDRLAEKSKYWKALAERWDEITHQMQIESGLYWEKKKKAKKTYDLIQEIISRVERDP